MSVNELTQSTFPKRSQGLDCLITRQFGKLRVVCFTQRKKLRENKKTKKPALSACFLSKSKIHVHVQSSPLKGHLRYCNTTVYGKQLCNPLEIR